MNDSLILKKCNLKKKKQEAVFHYYRKLYCLYLNKNLKKKKTEKLTIANKNTSVDEALVFLLTSVIHVQIIKDIQGQVRVKGQANIPYTQSIVPCINLTWAKTRYIHIP